MATSSEVMVAGRAPEHRAERGMDAALMGMMLFIASEVMFFAGLFAAYFTVRSMHDTWPPQGFAEHIEPLPLPAVLTVVLVLSSFTMQWAVGQIRKGNRAAMNRGLLVTMALGIVFLAGQLYDYSTLGFGINSGIYGTLFFTLTGFHGAHVFGGVIGIGVITSRGLGGQFSVRHHTAVEAVHYYWHFVDLVWIALFATLYFLK